MAQKEVLEFLEQHKRQWFTAKQIQQVTGWKYGIVSNALKRLRKSSFIVTKPVTIEMQRQGYTMYYHMYNDENV